MSQTPETPVGSSPPQKKFDFAAWWASLGLSGKLLAGGGLAGIIFSFLPAMSVSVSGGGLSMSESVLVIRPWQGKLGFLGFAGCLVLAYLMYQPVPSPKKRNQLFILLGCAGVAVLMTLWLFFDVVRAGSDLSSELVKASTSTGIGMYLTFLAAIAVGAGAGLKAKEEKLF